MDDAQFAEIAAWISKAGLAGEDEAAMVTEFCRRVVALSLPLARGQVFIDTLHPVYGGRGYYWQAARGETVATEYNTPTSRRLSKRLSRDHSGEVPDRTTLPNQSRGLGLTLAPLSRSDLVLWHETD